MTEIGTLPPAALPHEIGVDHGIEIDHFPPQSNQSQSEPGIPAAFKLKEVSSREDWEKLKPLIRRLYLNENMTREAATKHIAEEHNFRLTYVRYFRIHLD